LVSMSKFPARSFTPSPYFATLGAYYRKIISRSHAYYFSVQTRYILNSEREIWIIISIQK
jgi:hypothetical protein